MLTPARVATSPRRSPGTRRLPVVGSPACWGLILARREIRNSRTSARLSTSSTVGVVSTDWGALSVRLSSGSPTPAGNRVSLIVWTPPLALVRGPAPRASRYEQGETMRGVMMYCAGDVRVEEREDPRIVEPTDAIIRLTATCICGSDLWPYRGIEPADHQVMGHEYVGVVEEIGSVKTMKVGDFVVG